MNGHGITLYYPINIIALAPAWIRRLWARIRKDRTHHAEESD